MTPNEKKLFAIRKEESAILKKLSPLKISNLFLGLHQIDTSSLLEVCIDSHYPALFELHQEYLALAQRTEKTEPEISEAAYTFARTSADYLNSIL
jgi:hypothetical protein